MAKFVTTQTNFSAGKLSDKLYGRIDVREYNNGLSIANNCHYGLSGTAYKRFGTKYNTSNSLGTVIKSEIIEPHPGLFFKLTISFDTFQYQVRVETWGEDKPDPNDISIPHFEDVFIPEADADFFGFSWVVYRSGIVITNSSGRVKPFVIVMNRDGSLFKYDYEAFEFPHETYNPFGIQINAISSTGRLKLVGYGGVAVTNDQADFFANRSISASGYYPVVNGYRYIVTTVQLGSVLSYGAQPELQITAYEQPNSAQTHDFIATSWWFNSWYEDNYPMCVGTHEGRLYFGGTPEDPMALYGSIVGSAAFVTRPNYVGENAPPPEVPDNFGYSFTLTAPRGAYVTNIISSQESLIVTTSKNVLRINGGDAGLSRKNFLSQPMDSNGAHPNTIYSASRYVVYSSMDGKSIIMMDHGNKYTSESKFIDLSAVYGDVGAPIASLAWNPKLDTAKVLFQDGYVVYITINPQTGTVAVSDTVYKDSDWKTLACSYYKDGLFYNVNSVTPFAGVSQAFEGDIFSVYPNLQDHFFTVGSGIQTYADEELLQLISNFSHCDMLGIQDANAQFTNFNIEDGYAGKYIDIMYIYPTSQIDNDWSQGVSYGILKDYFVAVPPAPAPLSIVLPVPAQAILYGMPYRFHIATMPIEAGAQWGTAQLGLKRVDKIAVRHYNSTSYKVSSDGYNAEEVEVTPNSSGRKEISLTASSEYEQTIHITNDEIGPCEITTLSMRGLSNDG